MYFSRLSSSTFTYITAPTSGSTSGFCFRNSPGSVIKESGHRLTYCILQAYCFSQERILTQSEPGVGISGSMSRQKWLHPAAEDAVCQVQRLSASLTTVLYMNINAKQFIKAQLWWQGLSWIRKQDKQSPFSTTRQLKASSMSFRFYHMLIKLFRV